MVGPLRLGYGNVVAAGTILRRDIKQEDKLIVGKPHNGAVIDFNPNAYPGLSRILENNFMYLANLIALEQWYIFVRQPFFADQEFGGHIHTGLLDKLALAREERVNRLRVLAGKVEASPTNSASVGKAVPGRHELNENMERACTLITDFVSSDVAADHRDRFLRLLFDHRKDLGGSYLEVVRQLPEAVSAQGTLWLEDIILGICSRVSGLFPSLRLFRETSSRHRLIREEKNG